MKGNRFAIVSLLALLSLLLSTLPGGTTAVAQDVILRTNHAVGQDAILPYNSSAAGSANPPQALYPVAQDTTLRPSNPITQNTFLRINHPVAQDAILRLRYTPDILIVKFRPGIRPRPGTMGTLSTARPSLDALFAEYGVQDATPLFPNLNPPTIPRSSSLTSRSSPLTHIYRLRLKPGSDVHRAAEAFSADPNVEWAEPDYIAHAAFTPNDPRYSDQWGLSKIQADLAWDVTQGSPAVAIAIVDTGIDLNHPDLADKLWVNPGEIPGNGVDDDGNGKVDDVHGWDWVNNDNDPQDDIGHGTHVAGIAAAATDNGIGVAGVCPNCRVMALKVLDAAGQGTYSNIAQGITYAADKGARVINLSLGGYADSQLLRDAVAYASQYAVVVAAAGNDNRQDRFYPAAYDDYVVAVAATDNNDEKAAFSNYGDWVDISAPGVSIWSTLYDDTYAAWSGSSMATPFVAGVAGLIRSLHPDWSAGAVRGHLLHTADDIDSLNPGYEGRLGVGRVNAYRAVTETAQPELSIVGYAINGVPDGNPEPGSTVTMTVTLRNTWGDAAGVTAVLSTTDPYVTLIDDTADYGDIAGYETVTNTTDTFGFSVDAGAPFQHPITFTLALSDSAHYSNTLTFIVRTSQGLETVGGILSQDEIWVTGKTYLVTSNILVPSGVTLTIQPGVVVSFTLGGYYIQVDGTLIARGTPEHPIIFREGGCGIRFTDTSTDYENSTGQGSVVAYAIFEGIGFNSGPDTRCSECYHAAAIRIDNASPLITHNKIYPSGDKYPWCVQGILAYGTSSEISYNYIEGADWGALYAHGDPLVIHNEIARSGYSQNCVTTGGGTWKWNKLIGPLYGELGFCPSNGAIFENNFLYDAGNTPLRVGASDILIRNNTIWRYGVGLFLAGYITPTVTGNNFMGDFTGGSEWGGGCNYNHLHVLYTNSGCGVYGGGSYPTEVFTITMENNFWNSTSSAEIAERIRDRNDDFTVLGIVDYEPFLTIPNPDAPGFLWSVSTNPPSPVGLGPVTLTLDFSAPMSTTIQPTVTFGISPTYDTHIVAGDWVSSTRWVGTYNVTYYTGDGVQRLRVAGAVGADDGMEIPEDTRFTFEIATIGATSINAEPGYGYVALSWDPSDLETVAGYNVYRSTQSGGPYTRLNDTVLTTTSYTDTDVTNGTTYYYVVRLLTTDLYEMDYGTETAATPNDYTAPTTPVVVDDGTCTPYTDRLHACWMASDPESGITEYQYSIGTWAGGTDVINWTSAGTATEITRTGLSLIEGVTYYFNVKAKNGVGTWSDVGSSDGIEVNSGCPAVDFTASPRSGYRPLTVQFTDQTVGSAMARLWDFGDGTTDTVTNPIHTYNTTGTFTVTLTVTGSAATNTRVKPAYITVNESPPDADFTAYPTSGVRPLTVAFTDTSTGLVDTWLWDFGDGVTSTLQNPTHTYTTRGVYTVSLSIGGPGGTDSITRTNFITVYEPVYADFSAHPTTGTAPLTVQFTNLSSGDYTTSLWQFGDGVTSTLQNPTHTYTAAGVYTVSLTASGPGGTDSVTRTNFITVTAPPPQADFTANPTQGPAPLTVQFTDLSTGIVDTWLWDFGDGVTSTLQNPTHTYLISGTFSVSLTVSGPGGSDTEVKEGYIEVSSEYKVYLPLLLK